MYRLAKIPLWIYLFFVALVVGTIFSLYLVAGVKANQYQSELKTDISDLSSDSTKIYKSAVSEQDQFNKMKAILPEYLRTKPALEKVFIGSKINPKIETATNYDKDYQTLLTDYEKIIDEYFTKVLPIKIKVDPSQTETDYLKDYASRLDKIKSRRTDLEKKIGL
jgi:hypothetical protein